jgi:hypothetical protein
MVVGTFPIPQFSLSITHWGVNTNAILSSFQNTEVNRKLIYDACLNTIFSTIFCISTNGIIKNAHKIAIEYSLQLKGTILKNICTQGINTTINIKIKPTNKDKFKNLLENGFDFSSDSFCERRL